MKPWTREVAQKAKELIDRGVVGEIEFSGPTYQIEIKDPEVEEAYWVFLQLTETGGVKDSFTTAEEDENLYLAIAWHSIFSKPPHPLHQRFSSSMWMEIARELFDQDEEANLALDFSTVSTPIFQVTAKDDTGKAFLEEVFTEQEIPTEETSLKFSNLPLEELALWREGRPSLKLQLELSLFTDFSKWMFLQAERGEAKIHFIEQPDHLPEKMKIEFASVEVEMTLSTDFLRRLVPGLEGEPSNLKPLFPENLPQSELIFDEEEVALKVIGPEESEIEEAGLMVGRWQYFPGRGFLSRVNIGSLAKRFYPEEEIETLLNDHLHDVRAMMKQVEIFDEVITPKYELEIDADQALHIRAYAFESGDLIDPSTHLFGSWVYLAGKGFYPMDPLRFETADLYVAKEHVSSFVTNHRSWLSERPEFATHMISLSDALTYEVDEKGLLFFDTALNYETSAEDKIDYGQWIYLPKLGFYQKTQTHVGMRIRPGMVVRPIEMSDFIQKNRDELAGVENFFSGEAAVERTGLKMSYDPTRSVIQTQMVNELRMGLSNQEVVFYDRDVYEKGKGFSSIPIHPYLIEHFPEEKEIAKEEIDGFLAFSFEMLLPHILELDSFLTKPKRTKMVIDEVKKEGSRFFVKGYLQTEMGRISLSDLVLASHSKRRFYLTSAGMIDLHAPSFFWIRSLPKQAVFNQGLQLSVLDMIKLAQLEDPEFDTDAAGKKVWDDLFDLKLFSEPSLELFNGRLRPYQEKGLYFLWSLYSHHLSSMLSDDMGLGKTPQAIALLSAIKSSNPARKHFLVVCPTSVIYHWQDKLKTFFPQAKVFTYYGSSRSMEGFQEKYDVLVTSYGILRRDKELFSQIPFEVAVYDEVQLAKNSKSKLHQALLQVKAASVVGLTGTPIENNLSELRALFDVTLHGYLPGEKVFREEFQVPIERYQDDTKKRLLKKLIHPFLLRRKKEDVLKDLPEKIEEVSYVPLLREQYLLYEELLKTSRSAISELNDPSKQVPYIHIFSILSKLKQICNHPAVYLKDKEKAAEMTSGKWERFKELIHEILESGQKVVVFSQYLLQLDLIQDYLQEKGIGFAGIRGSTSNRGKEIDRFQTDPNCKVFVASLQAAGLGIELTAASVVVHYDRWWNAARENQATDRVHRIGQKRGVQVFKMVTRGTFEEKIHQMIQKKGQLLEEVVGKDDQELIKLLSRDELLQLLQDVHYTLSDQQEIISDL